MTMFQSLLEQNRDNRTYFDDNRWQLEFCVNYRKLRAVKVRESYPVTQMKEFRYSLKSANVLSTLDVNSGY